MEVNFKTASSEDLEMLVQVRFDFFASEEKWTVPPKQRSTIEYSLRHYYAEHINNDFFAVFVQEGGVVASVAFLSITEKPASSAFPTGKAGTLLNVFTYPQYRKKGYATKAISMLIQKAKEENLSYVELSTTESGRPLYEKLGFEVPEASPFPQMKLVLI